MNSVINKPKRIQKYVYILHTVHLYMHVKYLGFICFSVFSVLLTFQCKVCVWIQGHRFDLQNFHMHLNDRQTATLVKNKYTKMYLKYIYLMLRILQMHLHIFVLNKSTLQLYFFILNWNT